MDASGDCDPDVQADRVALAVGAPRALAPPLRETETDVVAERERAGLAESEGDAEPDGEVEGDAEGAGTGAESAVKPSAAGGAQTESLSVFDAYAPSATVAPVGSSPLIEKESVYALPAASVTHWKRPSKAPTAPSFHTPALRRPADNGGVAVW